MIDSNVNEYKLKTVEKMLFKLVLDSKYKYKNLKLGEMTSFFELMLEIINM